MTKRRPKPRPSEEERSVRSRASSAGWAGMTPEAKAERRARMAASQRRRWERIRAEKATKQEPPTSRKPRRPAQARTAVISHSPCAAVLVAGARPAAVSRARTLVEEITSIATQRLAGAFEEGEASMEVARLAVRLARTEARDGRWQEAYSTLHKAAIDFARRFPGVV